MNNKAKTLSVFEFFSIFPDEEASVKFMNSQKAPLKAELEKKWRLEVSRGMIKMREGYTEDYVSGEEVKTTPEEVEAIQA